MYWRADVQENPRFFNEIRNLTNNESDWLDLGKDFDWSYDEIESHPLIDDAAVEIPENEYTDVEISLEGVREIASNGKLPLVGLCLPWSNTCPSVGVLPSSPNATCGAALI